MCLNFLIYIVNELLVNDKTLIYLINSYGAEITLL